MAFKVRINTQIRAPELRVIGSDGSNLGVLSLGEALELAKKESLDLIEVSPQMSPPIAKVMDYGKFQYEHDKKERRAKAGGHSTEVKSIQVKIGTSEHDLSIKAKNASAWLKEGHRIRINLFLPGRSKYMEETFLKERVSRMLKLLSENYRIAEDFKKSPKGMTVVIEKIKK